MNYMPESKAGKTPVFYRKPLTIMKEIIFFLTAAIPIRAPDAQQGYHLYGAILLTKY